MNESIGGSALISLVVFIVGALLLIIVGALSYSKAYRVKNRIIGIIDKYEVFNDQKDYNDYKDALSEISEDLASIGYSSVKIKNCDELPVYKSLETKKNNGTISSFKIVYDGTNSYDYCVYETSLSDGSYYYTVVTFVHINFPVIESIAHVPVSGETVIYGKKYDN